MTEGTRKRIKQTTTTQDQTNNSGVPVTSPVSSSSGGSSVLLLLLFLLFVVVGVLYFSASSEPASVIPPPLIHPKHGAGVSSDSSSSSSPPPPPPPPSPVSSGAPSSAQHTNTLKHQQKHTDKQTNNDKQQNIPEQAADKQPEPAAPVSTAESSIPVLIDGSSVSRSAPADASPAPAEQPHNTSKTQVSQNEKSQSSAASAPSSRAAGASSSSSSDSESSSPAAPPEPLTPAQRFLQTVPPPPFTQPPVINTCKTRYFLYGVQPGEGFSLRKDAFVRMAVAMRLSASLGAGWVLVLPPWNPIAIPHWFSGPSHDGQQLRKPIRWNELWTMDAINNNGINIIDYEDYIKLQGMNVDTAVHACQVGLNDAYFARERDAISLGLSSYDHPALWHTYAPQQCSALKQLSPEQGRCATTPIINKQKMSTVEYGLLTLHNGEESLHCGLINLQVHGVFPLLDEFVNRTYSHGPCSIYLNHVQLVYWPGEIPSTEHVYHTRYQVLKHLNPALPIQRLAQLIQTRLLNATCPTGQACNYISMHVRRGDFLRVHQDATPTLKFLAKQIKDIKKEMPHLKSVFLASDMKDDEYTELKKHLGKQFPIVRLIARELASSLNMSSSELGSALPISSMTPYHLLVLDSYLAECAEYFVGTMYSYVTEQILQRRRAVWGWGQNNHHRNFKAGNPTSTQ